MRKPDLKTTAYLLAVATMAAVVGWLGFAKGVPAVWLISWLLEIGLLALAPGWPAAGLAAYVAMQYAVSSHGELHDLLLSWRATDALAALALIGWGLFRRPLAPPGRHGDGPRVTGALLLAWIGSSLAAALLRGAPWGPFPRHDPSAFFQCAVMFIIAADTLRSRRAGTAMAAVLVLAVATRATLQGVAGIYLESYVATLAVMAVPVAALGALIGKGMLLRLLFAAAVPGLVAVVALSQNRAAAVAAAAGVVALLLQCLTRRLRPRGVQLALLSTAVAASALLFKATVSRFQALFDPTVGHATAGLDRGTAQNRLDLWRAGWQMAQDAPLLGIGPGNFAAEVQYVLPGSDPLSAHSNYVQMLAETGFPGLALYLLFFGLVVVGLVRCAGHAPVGRWQRPAAQMLLLTLVVYLVGGVFNSRHDLALAYLIAGWSCAVMAAAAPPARAGA